MQPGVPYALAAFPCADPADRMPRTRAPGHRRVYDWRVQAVSAGALAPERRALPVMPLWPGVVTAMLVGFVYLLAASAGTFRFGQSAYPHHVLIADAWLHGQLSVREAVLTPRSAQFVERVRGEMTQRQAARGTPLTAADWEDLQLRLPPAPVMLDWSVVDGKVYAYFGPLPALLLLPSVALAGPDASDTLVSCLLGMTTVFLMFLVLRQAHRRSLITAPLPVCIALSLLFGLGTVHCYLTVLAQVWFLSQIVATLFLTLALFLILNTDDGVGWPLAAGAAFGGALLARAVVGPTIVFFYVALFGLALEGGGRSARRFIRQGMAFALPVVAAGALLATFNYARFGSMFESGVLPQILSSASALSKHRYALHGDFSWHYLARNLYLYFVNPALLRPSGSNAFTFDPQGNSMFLVTPAFLYLFRAYQRRNWFVRALWAGAAASIITLLFCASSGSVQFGNRYLLDSMPLLILLVAVGMRGRLSTVAVGLITLSIAANAWGTYRFYLDAGRTSSLVAAAAETAAANRAEAEVHLASLLAAQGNAPDAIAHYREALRWTPDHTAAGVELGHLLWTAGQRTEALAAYEAAVRLSPANPQAHNSLGVALADEAKTADAIDQFEEAVRLKPDYENAHYNLGTLLLRERRLDEAKKHFLTAIELRPTHGEAHNNLGFVLFEQGRSAEAIREYEQALQSKPDYAEAHNNLGVALAATGRTADAITHYEAALRLTPDHAATHRNLGAALAQQGDATRATAELQAALALDPTDSEARQRLDQLQRLARP